MRPHAPEPRRAARNADGRAQPAIRLRERTAPEEHTASVQLSRTTPFTVELRHPRLPHPGNMRIQKETRGVFTQNTGVSAGLLRKWPQVPARRFCPMRAIGLLACLHPQTAPSRKTPAEPRGVVRRTVAGPRRILTGFPSIARTSTKNKLEQFFHHESEYIMDRKMSMVLHKGSTEVLHLEIISI